MGRAVAHAHSYPANEQGSRRCHRCGSFLINRVLRRKLTTPSDSVTSPSTPVLSSTPVSTSTTTTTTTVTAMTVGETNMRLVPERPMIVKCVYISWCACVGTLARLYTDDFQRSNYSLQGSFLSNSLGSLALGALTASDLSEDNLPHLYTGLTVGLCGSYTTYSGWNLRLARGALGDASGPGGPIVAVCSLLVSVAFFASCFIAGGDIIRTLTSRGMISNFGGPGTSCGTGNTSAKRALCVMGALSLLLAVLVYVDDSWSRRVDWLACMFAPFGALLRFLLSRRLNSKWRNGAFPAGTFIANVSGSLMMGLSYYGVGAASKDLTRWGGVSLKAFQAGFLGCLTTMSSFVAEVVGHRERFGVGASYAYLAATAITALALVLVVGEVLGG